MHLVLDTCIDVFTKVANDREVSRDCSEISASGPDVTLEAL